MLARAGLKNHRLSTKIGIRQRKSQSLIFSILLQRRKGQGLFSVHKTPLPLLAKEACIYAPPLVNETLRANLFFNCQFNRYK